MNDKVPDKLLKIDRSLAQKFIKTPGQNPYLCYQCNKCSCGCPTAHKMTLLPHQIMRAVQLGQMEMILDNDSIFYCSFCHTCLERCPQGIAVSEIISKLKGMVAKIKGMPSAYKDEFKMIAETGRTSPLTSAVRRRREQLGLPSLSETVGKGEAKKIIKKTEIISYIEK
ncbi:MAG: 4Fe-4S dicluster domain-containing protein [Actinobacteria bacterium]|nr:4Fe-4S dicluster domain-containing protein [Actinomycetota bacterium]